MAINAPDKITMFKHIDHYSYYKNKTVMITGGFGYIGSSVARALSRIACSIILVEKEDRETSIIPNGTAEISAVKADVREKDIWKDLLKGVDVLFHFAAQTSSKLADENPSMDAAINLFPVIDIVETCKEKKLSPHIVFSGTVTEVGFTDTYPVDESYKDAPITIYDINKLAAEKYLQFYSSQLGNYAVTLRLANVYGPGPKSSSVDRGILNVMIRKALIGEPLKIYGDGNFVRDYIYIDDVAEAFLLAGVKIDVLNGNYYLIGSAKGHTIKDAVGIIKEKVAKKTKRDVEIAFVPPPEDISRIEYRNFVADTKSFRSFTGWEAKISLEEGIDRAINFFHKESQA